MYVERSRLWRHFWSLFTFKAELFASLLNFKNFVFSFANELKWFVKQIKCNTATHRFLSFLLGSVLVVWSLKYQASQNLLNFWHRSCFAKVTSLIISNFRGFTFIANINIFFIRKIPWEGYWKWIFVRSVETRDMACSSALIKFYLIQELIRNIFL